MTCCQSLPIGRYSSGKELRFFRMFKLLIKLDIICETSVAEPDAKIHNEVVKCKYPFEVNKNESPIAYICKLFNS